MSLFRAISLGLVLATVVGCRKNAAADEAADLGPDSSRPIIVSGNQPVSGVPTIVSQTTADGAVNVTFVGNGGDVVTPDAAVAAGRPAPGAFSILQPSATNETAPTLTWSAATGASSYDIKIGAGVGCGLVAAAATGLTGESWIAAPALSTGTWYVCVTARNDAGVTDATNNGFTLVVDDSVVATLGGLPAAFSADTALNVNVAGTSVAAYRGKVGLAASTDCGDAAGYSDTATAVATPLAASLAGLSDGPLRLCVLGRTAGGISQRLGAASAYSWVKDTVPPAVDVGADRASNAALPLTPTVTDLTWVTYAWTKTSGPGALTFGAGTVKDTDVAADADGTYVVRLTVTDAAGLSAYDEFTLSWDATAPTAAISGQPAGASSATSLAVDVGGAGVSTYHAKVGTVGSTDCSDATGYGIAVNATTDITTSLTGFSDGALRLCVVGVDLAGNRQAYASATATNWTKDTTDPTVDAGAGSADAQSPVSQDATVTDATALTYSWTKVSGPGDVIFGSPTAADTTIAADTNGTYVLRLTATDAAGNAASDDISFVWNSPAPTAGLTGQPTGVSATQALAVNVGGAAVTHYRYKVGLGADCSDASGYGGETDVGVDITASLAGFADGTVRLCIVGRNAALAWQAFVDATAVTWVRDRTSPVVDAGADAVANASVSQAATVTDASSLTYTWAKISGPGTLSFGSGSAEDTTISADVDGVYVARLTATDAAGNSASDDLSLTWDTTAPTASITGAPTGSSTSTSLLVDVAGTDVTHYRHKVGATGGADCAAPSGYSAETAVTVDVTDSLVGVTDGPVRLCVVSRDSVGNWQPFASATISTWTKDVTSPSAGNGVATVNASNVTATSMTVTWNAAADNTTAQSSLEYQVYRSTSDNLGSLGAIDGGAGTVVQTWSPNLLSFNATGLAEATAYYFNVVVRDGAGNRALYTRKAQSTADLQSANWDFATAGEYTYDSTKAQVAFGTATLIGIDQTDDGNTASGFGGGAHTQTEWNSSQVTLLAAQTSGTFTSRIIDAGGDVNWTSLAWTPERPSMKALPSALGVETAYTAGNLSMSGNLVLLHMQESSWNGTAGEVADSSGSATPRPGRRFGNATTGAGGRFSRGAVLDGDGDYIDLVSAPALPAQGDYSFTFWVKPTSVDVGGVSDGSGDYFIDRSNPGNPLFSLKALTGNIFCLQVRYDDGSNLGCASGGAITAGQWHHIVMVRDYTNSLFRLYMNGAEVATKVDTRGSLTFPSTRIGCHATTNSGSVNGVMDEFAAFSRALTPTEVRDHFLRGGSRLSLQVRSCGNADCSDTTFAGPGGDTTAYYTEELNATVGTPSVALTGVSMNRYFQYRATFATQDAAYPPGVKALAVGPSHLNAGSPQVASLSGPTFAYLTGFSATMGAGNTGTAKYQLSRDGSTWYWHNGSAWVAASASSSQANTAAQLNTNAGTFHTQVGAGTLRFRAFLNSNLGAEAVELDQIDVDYATVP